MRRSTALIIACLATCAALVLAAAAAFAQTDPWRLAEGSDGTIYLLHDGVKQEIDPAPMDDGALAAIPDAGPLPDNTLPAPTRATSPAAPLVAPLGSPTAAPSQPQQPVSVSGADSSATRPFHLNAGNYTVTWAVTPKLGGNFILNVVPVSGDLSTAHFLVNTIVRAGAAQGGETQMYGVPDGSYFANVIGDGSWTVALTPLH